MNGWPPDWRTARVESLIGRELRLGEILIELDEAEDLVSDDRALAAEVRQLSARLRTRRNDWRDQIRAWQPEHEIEV